MKKFVFAGALAAFVLGASAASAADLGVEVIPVAPSAPVATAFDWTGTYVGVTAGHAWGDATGSAPGFEQSFDQEGLFGGAMLGVNRQFGNIVIGGEVTASFGDISGSTDVFGTTVESKIDAMASARARVGYAFDRFLPYLTGGLAVANNTVTVPGFGVEDSALHVGYIAGLGLEYAFTDNLTVRGEYTYADFGSADYGLGLVEGDLDAHMISAGISYKF